MANTNRTQTERVLNSLKNGKTLTANQITRQFKAGNPYEVIRKLREQGHAIYTNLNSNRKANYRLGKARKSVVATAYNRLGAAAFN